MNKTAICLIIVFLIVISIISYLLLSPCPDGKEKKGFKCVDKAAASTSSMQRPKLVGVASGCTSATPFRNEGICVASCPLGKVADSNGFCICSVQGQVADSNGVCRVPRQIIPLGGKNADCPQSHPLKEYGTCVSACAPGLFKSGNNCVPVCTPGTVLDIDPEYGPICRSSCLSTRPYIDLSNGVTPVCISSCPSSRPLNTTTLSPAGTYRNDISMCVPINPLSAAVVTKTAISEGFPNQRFVNIIDGSFNTLYNPMNTTSPTWVYFQNVTKSGQLLYGFTIKFGREGGEPNVNLKIYNNNTTLTDNNKIFDETFLNVGGDIMVRRSFNPPINVTNLYLLFSRWIFIYEFEVTVR